MGNWAQGPDSKFQVSRVKIWEIANFFFNGVPENLRSQLFEDSIFDGLAKIVTKRHIEC